MYLTSELVLYNNDPLKTSMSQCPGPIKNVTLPGERDFAKVVKLKILR
jgi:hypothetical protein